MNEDRAMWVIAYLAVAWAVILAVAVALMIWGWL